MTTLEWNNQTTDPKKFITFTAPQNKNITLPPRRYILIAMALKEIQEPLPSSLITIIKYLHHHAAAPEPLNQYGSHFQIFRHQVNTKKLFISLTNTSSRKIRQQLLLQTLQHLNLLPIKLIYQEQSIENCEEMDTPDESRLLTALLETKQERSSLLTNSPTPPLHTMPLHHILTHFRPPQLS